MVTLVFIIFFIHVFQHVYSTPEILGFIFKSTLFDLDICLLTSIFRKLLWRLSESNWMSICLFMIIFNEKIVPNYCRLSVSFIILYITTLVRIDYLWMYYFLLFKCRFKKKQCICLISSLLVKNLKNIKNKTTAFNNLSNLEIFLSTVLKKVV